MSAVGNRKIAKVAGVWRELLTKEEREALADIERERGQIRDRQKALRKSHFNLIWKARDRAAREKNHA